MAQKTIIELVDDLTGEEADETVVFGLDGKTYEIDLSTANGDQLREVLAPYVEKGRKLSASSGPGRKSARGAKATGVGRDSSAVREWARKNGWPNLGNRGRVPREVEEAYLKAN
ncbi:histone-like nucleoid-structuring protein Lsr2 [Streptomyces sp. Tu6071]|uniref:histone-like nucleoid-structuring protein Lsr2 n=1 Tax=Streptomyces sp. Tu6071 TaxID=355249 RepID=UPI0005B83AE0|nr:Lsr2 family protein [Streptomyces sp. Tu6071]